MTTKEMTSDPLHKAAGSLREQVHEGLEHAHERANNLYRRGKDRAVELEHRMEDRIREKPMKSVLVAAGVGAGVGLLLGIVLARR